MIFKQQIHGVDHGKCDTNFSYPIDILLNENSCIETYISRSLSSVFVNINSDYNLLLDSIFPILICDVIDFSLSSIIIQPGGTFLILYKIINNNKHCKYINNKKYIIN
eukprot:36229_1